MDAVLQLIQLSGSSDDDSAIVSMNFPAKIDEDVEEGSRSAGEALSSNFSENCSDNEPLPRRKPKFGSLSHIYKTTQPLMKNRSRKRPRF